MDYFNEIEFESKLSLVIRKPQEGKTFICIANIKNDLSRTIHIVLTMNTIDASSQFFGRLKNVIGCKRIVVFNSNKHSACDCHYAKTSSDVFELIMTKDIKVIVCCAHDKRFRESIPQIIRLANAMEIKPKFVIHIDEAHQYIPSNINYIRAFNQSPVVNEIIGYTATPNGIWRTSEDPLFHKILIRDVESELAIIRSPDYFGVERCTFINYEELDHKELQQASEIDINIPASVLKFANIEEGSKHPLWYGDSWYFDAGNELLLLAFVTFILPQMQILNDCFSYHFIPAYNRKATHYQIVDIILKSFSNANVIVMNGNGIVLFRMREILGEKKSYICNTDEMVKKSVPKELREQEEKKLTEPSYMIQQLIKNTPNCPTFITGFTCVGMSVSLIGEEIGNFDSVVMAHQHYGCDKLYQLCRFLFNYSIWSAESRARIKTTKFYSLTNSVVQTCLKYEENVEKMCTEFAGKVCSIREIQGLEPEEPTESEIRKKAIDSITLSRSGLKKFKVYDGNDHAMWESADTFYESILGKKMNCKTKPTLVDDFYECSITKHVDKQTTASINALEKHGWKSTFSQLLPDKLSYARTFVGYEDIDDPTEYTIYVKFAQIEDTEANREVLKKYGKPTKK